MNLFQTPISSRAKFIIDFLITIFGIFIVFVATLYPFDLQRQQISSLQELIAHFDNYSSYIDQINNILLFMPVGFGATSLLRRVKIQWFFKLILVIILSAGLSTTVEVLQIFIPGRTPTPADIFNNTLGGVYGFFCLDWLRPQTFTYTLAQIEKNKTRQSIKKLTVFFIGYIVLSCTILFNWQDVVSLNNWDANLPLILGNEMTGNRPWTGYVYEVNIVDKAISKNAVRRTFASPNYLNNLGDSLVASYQLNGQENYTDKTGKLSELAWKVQFPNQQNGKGVFLDSNHWLQSTKAVTSLNKRIAQTSEFTFSAIVSTANTEQTGPARIVSISSNPLYRNFTIGQHHTYLDLRVRSPITGENGSDIEIRVPNVFKDTNPHHIVVTYAKGFIQVYTDNLKNYSSFNLLDLIPKDLKIYRYSMNFIPIGLYLALLTALAKRRVNFYRLFLPIGILLPAALLEFILVNESGKHISLKNLLIGVLITAGTMLAFRIRASLFAKKAAIM